MPQPEEPARDEPIRRLLIADYLRLYDGRNESASYRRTHAPERFLSNPSLHAAAMIRAALQGPPPLFGLWRRLLHSKHGIDLERGCRIGPGLILPHPMGIVINAGTVVGSNAILYHNVTIGSAGQAPGTAPVLGDGVTVHMNAVIAPGAVIGDRAVIGANAVVEGEVPEGASVAARRPALVSEGAPGRPG